MEKTTKKRIFSWVSFLLSAAIFALALYVFITSITARSRNNRTEIFGYSFAIVVTNSMSPEIKVGDLIVVKSCDITEIKEGQNAVFIGLSGDYKDKSIVHKVVGIYDIEDDTGRKSGIYLETWGINNSKYDDDYVYAENFIGIEIYHSTFLGGIMSFLKDPINWMYLLVILLAIMFAVKQIIKIVKTIKNKRQQEASKGQDEIIEDSQIETVNNEQEEVTSEGKEEIPEDKQDETIRDKE